MVEVGGIVEIQLTFFFLKVFFHFKVLLNELKSSMDARRARSNHEGGDEVEGDVVKDGKVVSTRVTRWFVGRV